MSLPSAEMQSKVAIWRAKAVEGTITEEEMCEAMAALRGERVTAASATTTARKVKAKAAIPSADDLLDEMGGA